MCPAAEYKIDLKRTLLKEHQSSNALVGLLQLFLRCFEERFLFLQLLFIDVERVNFLYGISISN